MAVSGHGGESSGGGANGTWPPFVPAIAPLPHLPPTPPSNQAASGRYTTSCIESKTKEELSISIWASYPINWSPTEEELILGAKGLLSDPDFWESYEIPTDFPPLSEGNSRFANVGTPEDLCRTRAEMVEWINCNTVVASVSLEFGEIGGYPRVKWTVRVDFYQCFSYLFLPPFVPPIPPVPSLPQGDGGGQGILFPSFSLFGGSSLWRKKKLS